MKKISLCLSLLFACAYANAEALIFNGVGNYDNQDSPLGVKIYRGAKEQRKHEMLMKERGVRNDKQDLEMIKSTDQKFIRKYELSNVDGVYSTLSINNNGTFYWSMKYDKTYLNTKGNWKLSSDRSYLILDTSPKPKDIMFNYVKTIEDSPRDEVQRLGNGDLKISINQKKSDDFELKGVDNVLITCYGTYGTVTAKTNKEGVGICEHAGLPLRKLVLKASGIPNDTYWSFPKFEGTHWNFEFDILSAHTDYWFTNEMFKIDEDRLVWNGRSLGANQFWVYH